MIDNAAIEAAARRLQGIAVRTPLLRCADLDARSGGTVLIKPECLQVTGSFKIRGAYNCLRLLSPDAAAGGVVAWSSGNHAQGVAAAGRLLGIRTTIVMPADAPAIKLDNTRRLGGTVVTYDRHSGDREAIARDLAATSGAALVPSYDHGDLIAGQGTVGLELAESAIEAGLPPDQVLVACSGGGLMAGCATALRARLPDVALFTVEPDTFDDTAKSLASGRRERVAVDGNSICDALQAPTPGDLTLPVLRTHAVRGLTVTDTEVRAAMRYAFRELKLVVEPGGAVALAALLAGRLETRDRITAIVISGGNVEPSSYAGVVGAAGRDWPAGRSGQAEPN